MVKAAGGEIGGDIAAEVVAAFAQDGDPRLAEIMRAAVRHLHAFAAEVELTREEWLAGIEFLTAVGKRCDEVRQEFILLSDTLGLSMLLELINEQPADGATEPTVIGPFYVPGAPARSYGDSIVDDVATEGQALLLSGTVNDLAGGAVADATLEVWQVQPNGLYDIEEHPAKRNLRGTFRTTANGEYKFTTVRPVDYTIPDDGPVGAMLRAGGRPSWRPAHIHLKVSAPGYKTLVTHVFDAASEWLTRDAVFGVRQSIIVPLDQPECVFDLVLERAR
jgi:catechol 1,2-dioxygenase